MNITKYNVKSKILDKLSKYSPFQLLTAATAIIIIMGLIVATAVLISQTKRQKQAEAAVYAASDEGVEICLTISEEMGIDAEKEPTYAAYKASIDNANSAIDKYYTTHAFMNYTFEAFRKYIDKSAAEYINGDPNDYKAISYQKKLNELQREFIEKQRNLENAKQEYTVIK